MSYDRMTVSDDIAKELQDIAKSLRLLSGRESLKDEYEEPLRKEREAVQALLDAIESQLSGDIHDQVLDNAQKRLNDKKVRR